MKKIFLLIALGGLLLGSSCTQNPQGRTCCKKDSEPKVAERASSGESLYDLTSVWENQDGQSIKLSDLQGKVVVAAMVFTNCASACPRITADIQQIESLLSPQEKQQVRFLLISMDPKRDDPARMKEFSASFQLGANWTLIRSSEDATMEMANVLGVKVKPLSDGGFDHSNVIHILDQKGEIVFQQNGLGANPEQSVREIKSLLKSL